ncbi:uncharacterized protein DUF262 [Marinilabilia salmonicolor]|jgi:uncharacterized protein with ParB-like and HNH nuclease domain|uniref:DUF262 domain-containing protein n=1 Tax=Marinilabilia salmonicolor TaxID=989 RepID=UPI000D06A602|nr:DUF262 domain-containing protein [Marinilabilia salmonicolor]PRY98292.1 uncharacterized protein DUF262 [Marinilabilia salmonicolor]
MAQTTSEKNQLNTDIISIKDLLTLDGLQIPVYQRPYKWKIKNVNQLLDDIITHKDKSAYRIGTIVFHKDEMDILNIVDGQQRSITILLIALALLENEKIKKIASKEKYHLVTPNLFSKSPLKNSISKQNIKENYAEIKQRIKEFDFDSLRFFYDKCQLVKVELSDVSEAFQFFDSQNARGKDLYPHDLLKAFHLREMVTTTAEQERNAIIEEWESLDQNTLERLFEKYLFRIKNWSKGYSARIFTKNQVDLFKGISPEIKEPYPFASIYRISNYFIEGYNQNINRKIDLNHMNFPFQLDQAIINGKRFFEFITHYKKMISETTNGFIDNNIIKTLNNYPGKFRKGDRYVRALFDCCLIFYIDKFGFTEMERAIEKIFIWTYKLRVEHYSIQLATIDNHALNEPSLFKIIKEATHPKEVFSTYVTGPYRKIPNPKTTDIVNLFNEMGYEQ